MATLTECYCPLVVQTVCTLGVRVGGLLARLALDAEAREAALLASLAALLVAE
jgi:hypothetical protein